MTRPPGSAFETVNTGITCIWFRSLFGCKLASGEEKQAACRACSLVPFQTRSHPSVILSSDDEKHAQSVRLCLRLSDLESIHLLVWSQATEKVMSRQHQKQSITTTRLKHKTFMKACILQLGVSHRKIRSCALWPHHPMSFFI